MVTWSDAGIKNRSFLIGLMENLVFEDSETTMTVSRRLRKPEAVNSVQSVSLMTRTVCRDAPVEGYTGLHASAITVLPRRLLGPTANNCPQTRREIRLASAKTANEMSLGGVRERLSTARRR